MKSAFPYVGLVGAIVLLGALTWYRMGGRDRAPAEQEGFPVMCAQADCGYAFVIPREQSRTYPRGPNGEGFQCPKCGKFSARMAVRCSDCGRLYLPEGGRGQGASPVGCPYCNPSVDISPHPDRDRAAS